MPPKPLTVSSRIGPNLRSASSALSFDSQSTTFLARCLSSSTSEMKPANPSNSLSPGMILSRRIPQDLFAVRRVDALDLNKSSVHSASFRSPTMVQIRRVTGGLSLPASGRVCARQRREARLRVTLS